MLDVIKARPDHNNAQHEITFNQTLSYLLLVLKQLDFLFGAKIKTPGAD